MENIVSLTGIRSFGIEKGPKNKFENIFYFFSSTVFKI